MSTWKQAFREGLVSGSLASLFSAAYLAAAGWRRGHAAAPINAVSHWVMGDRSFGQDRPSVVYTATGYLTHHLASLFWAVLHAKAWGTRPEAKKPVGAALGAVAASSIACFVDYELTPKRLTPGFEHRLAKPEMTAVYAFFALGLMAGSLLMKPKR
ncbi:hypothetical protein JJB11_22560 [Ramlibacter ginsenosidimutans]|uniref:Uncharacterized protein n=1 Tax=Ramlibacter ginsenosidimutans TaxID=502333 RepID=A0A934TWP8_9BURK|nr:hypothetical protein [Ramlibacter ginsenosidimutans]MBK6008889.1 hypothetical protein [Ramlibacter ginsenosidimutans]